jgi:hypothetical protein
MPKCLKAMAPLNHQTSTTDLTSVNAPMIVALKGFTQLRTCPEAVRLRAGVQRVDIQRRKSLGSLNDTAM